MCSVHSKRAVQDFAITLSQPEHESLMADTVSSPNYSGSVGFGESSVRALLGNCGTLDVQDCIATVRNLVDIGISVEGKGNKKLSASTPRSAVPPDWLTATAPFPGVEHRQSPSAYSRSPRSHTSMVSKCMYFLFSVGWTLRVTQTHGLEYYHALKGKARTERPEQDVEMH
ncbi:hypothetical protein DFH09DRAFT_1070317 [Mycena vulgaris]|nr:hypothetical protein DFH09DRAFT_1070317 [Mycena vulgaris]